MDLQPDHGFKWHDAPPECTAGLHRFGPGCQSWRPAFGFDNREGAIYTGAFHRIGRLEATESMKYFLAVMGMVMIVEGLPYFAFPDKMKQVMRQVLEVEDAALRRFGLFLMGLGLAAVFLGQRG
jgi:uncharacterized protein YjeT (DUF2065 family)